MGHRTSFILLEYSNLTRDVSMKTFGIGQAVDDYVSCMGSDALFLQGYGSSEL